MGKQRCIDATTLLLSAVTREKQAQADQLRAIVSLAQNYSAAIGATLDDALIDELIEDTVRGGSLGTPPVSEFAGMELGPLMGCSTRQGNTILFETLNLCYRHPSLWAAVQNLSLDAHRARKAAGKFGVLSPKVADRVGRLWAKRQHRLSWQGAIDLCDKLIVAADPDLAAEREARQLCNRHVRIWEHHEATVNLTAKLDVLDARYVDATVTQLAEILHRGPGYEQVALDVLRAKALGIMAHPALALTMIQDALQQPIFGSAEYDEANRMASRNPECTDSSEQLEMAGPVDPDTGRVAADSHRCPGHVCGTIAVAPAKLQPRVQVYIHINADGTADIEGAGTVAVATLRELLDGKQIRATPVIDLNTIPAEHQYHPSKRLREAACLLFPIEAFPFSNRSSRGLDLDHTTAFRKACRNPQTRIGNLGPFSRRPHRAKTAGFWKCQQPRVGQLLWISPLGFRYIVDRDGTHRLE